MKLHSMLSVRRCVRFALFSAMGLGGQAQAALDSALLNIGRYSNQIEADSAAANQAIFNQLTLLGCSGRQTEVAGAAVVCTPEALQVYRFVSEVAINAEDILNGRITAATTTPGSLGRPNTLLLGRALQWCNGEEFTGLGAQASAFTGGQVANLATRISALRFGTIGPARMASNALPQVRGGGASADAQSGSLSSGWSAFINGDYTKGTHDVTTNEAKYDFRGRNFTLGVDKRLTNQWVIGVIYGHQDQDLKFIDVLPDPANVVNAATGSKGNSLLPYVLWQADHWYFNASVGYQQMQFETARNVDYASGAALPVGSSAINHQTLSTSKVNSSGWSSYETIGYSWRPSRKWVIEPSLSADWRHVTIDAFTESEAVLAGAGGFNFAVDEQRINSLEVIPALRLQYSFTPSRGVITPYVDAQWHRQLRDQARVIKAVYADVAELVSDTAKFNIRSDQPDDSYQVYTAGFSAVLTGSARGGVQVYGNYRWYRQLDNFSMYSISGGIRYEF